MIPPKWDRRIARATELASSYPFAAEGLRFYACVATFQKSLYAEIQQALADSPKISSARPLRDELDLSLLLPKFPGLLTLIERIAPSPLAQAAAGLAQKARGMAAGDREVLARGSRAERGCGRRGCSRLARGKFGRNVPRLDLSSALCRVSCRFERTCRRAWNAFDLPPLRRQADRGRLAQRR